MVERRVRDLELRAAVVKDERERVIRRRDGKVWRRITKGRKTG